MSIPLIDDNNVMDADCNESDKENKCYSQLVDAVSQIICETNGCKESNKNDILFDIPANISFSGLRKRKLSSESNDKKGLKDLRRISISDIKQFKSESRIVTQLRKSTLIDYIYNELRRGYLLENDQERFTERREKFYMFLKIPREFEKFIWFGFFQCVDAFLFIFTLLPIRFLLSVWFIFSRSFIKFISMLSNNTSSLKTSKLLQPAEVCDFLKGIIILAGYFLLSYVDTSILYHMIKSQSVIKLYIFFNMLELADKLITSFGLDILDALYWTATEPKGKKREHIGVVPHLVISIFYVFFHSILILLQATTLNVAINSSNKALLTIMMSNNFVELKGMVFKKFAQNNLFHMSCSDVRERLHILILLIVVVIQTMKEYNWDKKHFWILLPDCLLIFVAEFGVDWVKHCFVTRFNDLSHEVYHTFTISLSYDLASSNLKSAFSDHLDLISRRMGFIPIPLCLLLSRTIYVSLPIAGWYQTSALILGFLCMISLKCWLNILLLGKACENIEKHRILQKKKASSQRQCSSLPSSRYHSVEDLLTTFNSKSTLNIAGQFY